MFRKIVLFSLLSALIIPNSFADSSNAGVSGGQFLKIGVDAKTAALGGASAALSGAESIFYNPAGTSDVDNFDILLSQVSWIQDTRYSNAAVAKRFDSGVYSFAINYLSVPPIDKYNNLGVKLDDSYTVSDMALIAGYSTEMYRDIKMGGSIKYIKSRLDDVSASAIAVDLGVKYNVIPTKLDLGFALQNMGSGLRYVNQSDPLPFNIKLGGKWNILARDYDNDEQISLLADANSMNDIGVFGNIGVELEKDYPDAGTIFSLRCGYATNLTDKYNGLSVGFGVNYKKMYTFDYAYAPFGDLGSAHRVSFSIHFDNGK